MTSCILLFQAHEDPMYDIIRENKRNEKETRYIHLHVVCVLFVLASMNKSGVYFKGEWLNSQCRFVADHL